MTQEEAQILLKDLCARVPYSVMYCCKYYSLPIKLRYIGVSSREEYLVNGDFFLQEIKPYLRPMSSMTEEEKENLQSLHDIISDENYGDGYSPSAWDAITEWEDYCNSRHLDYRGLIPMGLALEAPKDMYKTE